MKRILTFSLAICGLFSQPLFSQRDSITELGFEQVLADSGAVLNGSDGQTLFTHGSLQFPVSWDETYKYWSGGWAVSSKIDGSDGPSSSSRYLYCAKPGWGAEGARTGKVFKVGQNGSWFRVNGPKVPGNWPLLGFYIANSNYTYNSMDKGDMFAKKFGGVTGKDPDSLLLVIRAYESGVLKDSQLLFLGDFRSADSTKDYLLDSWTFVRFRNIGGLDSFTFSMVSSDVGAWGMNTPAFFCLDRVKFLVTLDVNDDSRGPQLAVFPVPTAGMVHLKSESALKSLRLLDMTGRIVLVREVSGHDWHFDAATLPAGQYQLQVQTTKGLISRNLLITE